jgi:dTDP-4-dehydrorhamnose reductase
VYSEHGKNFVKTMLKLMSEREELKVVNDQIGSPTYAADLAAAIMQVISETDKGNEALGVYHYSNSGVISWFDFASAITELSGSNCKVLPVTSDQFPTPAKRPNYSVMDISKIQTAFNIKAVDWRTSLEKCLRKLSAVS